MKFKAKTDMQMEVYIQIQIAFFLLNIGSQMSCDHDLLAAMILLSRYLLSYLFLNPVLLCRIQWDISLNCHKIQIYFIISFKIYDSDNFFIIW